MNAPERQAAWTPGRLSDGQARAGRWWSRVDPNRSLLMMAAGATLGLAIAGFGLFTAKGTATNTVPAEDVALVNGKPILVSDFIAQLEAEAGEPYSQTTRDQRQKVVNDMIREELFVQRGLELEFPASDPDTRTALVAAVEQQVAADVTAQQPSEQTLVDYFNGARAAYASDGFMTLHELVLPGPADGVAMGRAALAVKALRQGIPIETVTGQYGLRESGRVNDGAEFYFAAKIHLGDKLFDVARRLTDGSVSDPQPAADGVHILDMVSNHTPVLQSYDEARQKVFFNYKKDEQTKLEKADVRYLRAKADVQIAKAFR